MDANEDVEPAGLSRRGASKGGSHSDTSGKLWSVYLSEADRQDKALAENWKGDTEGILIFTGLFAATVAAFIIESYKQLSSDSGTATVLLLNQISQQLSALALSNGNGTTPPPPPLYNDDYSSSFRPTMSAIRVNILWFLSLTLSLICALAATLMQQWARRYLQQAQAQTTLYKRARTRAYLFEGVQAFRLSEAVEAVPLLLHVAVFLFFAGLVDFLFSIDTVVGRVIFGVMCFFGGTYILLTFLSNVRPNCPYRTPFSRDWLKWFLVVPTAPAFLVIYGSRCFLRRDKFDKVLMHFLLFVQSLLWTMSDAMRSLQEHIDKGALRWAVATVDDDDDIETLVEGIPGYLTSGTSRNGLSIIQDLLDLQQPKPLGHLINRLIQTCTPEGYRGAAENVRRRRALTCLDTRVLDRRVLRLVLLRNVWVPDVAFRQLIEAGRRPRDRHQRSLHRRAGSARLSPLHLRRGTPSARP
ncbi:hypothetical protein BJV74DRAFT_474668 [Russula compacta]|nr:hypothetical protein BJV74DRAFT_474668 [Russula compacta]